MPRTRTTCLCALASLIAWTAFGCGPHGGSSGDARSAAAAPSSPAGASASASAGTGGAAGAGAAVASSADAAATPPVSLTASDGTGLRLTSLAARAVVEDPLAFTELRMSFENPLDRRLEGTFKITLPEGATVARFAMKIDDVWQEGEVVEKQAAREAYEDFLHRRQDPALLEQAAGNEFSARVFPIPPRGVKEIVVSYSQEISSDASYTLPLRGLPTLGSIDVSVATGDGAAPVQVLKERSYTPRADFTLEQKARRRSQGLRSGNLAVLRVRPEVDTRPEPVASALFLFDTSASRALGFGEQVKLLERLVKQLDASAPIAVACFDQQVELSFAGTAGSFDERALAHVRDRMALGASDLERALAWAKDEAKKRGLKRVVLVGDGVATAGATEREKLRGAVRAMRDGGVERLDAVAVGGLREDATLRALATAGLAEDGVVVDGARGATEIAQRMAHATRSGVDVKIDGATWSYPHKLDGVQPGDERLVYAEVPADKPVKVSVSGSYVGAVAYDLDQVDRPLLQRAWAEAKIASLLDGKDASAPPTVQQITNLSIANRVLSPYTALLVLETDADYARFQIDRRAPAEILTVEGGRLATVKRAPPAKAAAALARATADASGNGNEREGREESKADFKDKKEAESTAAPGASAAANAGPVVNAPPPPPALPAPKAAAPETEARPVATAARPSPAARPRAVDSAEPWGGAGGGGGAGTGFASSSASRGDPSSSRAGGARGIGGRVALGPSAPSASSPARAMGHASPAGDDRLRALGADADADGEKPQHTEPYEGKFKEVMDALGRGGAREALPLARAWHDQDPGDVLALVALGQTWEAEGTTDASSLDRASRAYGSIIDLFPARADLRRFAGERLEHLTASRAALDLALDTFAKAKAERPDHPASHRLLAYALLRKGNPAKAFDAIAAGLKQRYPDGRFAGVTRILREDLGLIAAAWIRAEPARREEIERRLSAAGGVPEKGASIRFVLNWETDANDVDFHIFDAHGGHAFYSSPHLRSGGDLYADVTTGYGPECFTIRGARAAGPYTLQANYFSRGPMGYGMGKLEIIQHDGSGGLKFEERPFVVMVDHAFVDLGSLAISGAARAAPAP